MDFALEWHRGDHMSSRIAGDNSIIQPRPGKRDPRLSPDAIMVMIPSELDDLAGITRAQKVSFSDGDLYRLYRSTTPGKECTLSLAGPFVGAPHAVMAMERLIAMGATRVWALGWCGSLQPWLTAGHILVPDSAVSEEGTSRHYPITEPLRPDDRLVSLLETVLEEEGLNYVRGPVWTTDAPYRETVEKVADYQRRGILAVEMEMSALMTLALYRGVSMAALLVVSDELSDLKWKPGFSNPLLRENSRAAARALLGTITRVRRETE